LRHRRTHDFMTTISRNASKDNLMSSTDLAIPKSCLTPDVMRADCVAILSCQSRRGASEKDVIHKSLDGHLAT
jgi:hypothetical protein